MASATPTFAQVQNGEALSAVQTPIKSQNDKREYRYLRLSNQMQVLLVSDPETEQSAAAMQVGVGSAQDPKDRQGLAHFLEHMLFLGTQAYPKAGEYQNFISRSGGSHNAYTSLSHTKYYFDVRPGFLAPALKRFAQFFVSPLFNATYVDREREAVNAEYLAKIKDDGRRLGSVLREIANPAHPLANFTVGNMDTLADSDKESVRDALLQFYQRYYSANLMSLVVLGREDLDQLEAMVRNEFTTVPNHDRVLPQLDEPIFLPNKLPMEVRLQPEKELREMRILFPMPAVERYYREKPLVQIANLLGHEGRNSLLSALKHEGLVEALYAGADDLGAYGNLFTLTVSLTPKGMANVERVKSWIFAAIELVRQQGLVKWQFDELKQLANINFRFQASRNPVALVSNLASNLQLYPAVDVLRAPYLYQDFDRKLSENFASYLRPENSVVLITDSRVNYKKVSRLYHVPYNLYRVKPVPLLSNEKSTLLRLPTPNPFIPARLQVRDIMTQGALPQLAINEPALRLWYRQDEQFNIPKSEIRIQLRSPAIADGIRGRALAQLFVAMVLDELNEYSYPAFIAGLGFDIDATARGFEISIAGYNDRQGLLLTEILEAMVSPRLSPERFANIRAELIRKTRNGGKQPPYIQLLRQLVPALYSPAWADDELAVELANTGLADLKQFTRNYSANSQVDMLAYGNLLPAEARQLATLVGQQLVKGTPIAVPGRLKVIEPRLGGYQAVVATLHQDNALFSYHQARSDSLDAQAHMLVLAQSIKSPFFNQLRTEQQLGYIVFSSNLPIADFPGIGLVAQSPAASVAELAAAFDGFIESLPAWLGDDLDAQKAAVLADLQQKPKTLREQAGLFWGDIALAGAGGKVDFDRRRQLAVAVSEVNTVTLRTYAYQVFDPSRRLMMATQPLPIEAGLPPALLDLYNFKRQGRSVVVP